MSSTSTKLAYCFLFCLISICSRANPNPVLLTDSLRRAPIGLSVAFLEDTSRRLTLSDVRSKMHEAQFKLADQRAPNYGFRNSPFWLRFTVRNLSQDSLRQWVFEQAFRGMSYIDVYVIDTAGVVIHQRGGDFVRQTRGELTGAAYAFLLPVKPRQAATVYVRMIHYGGQAFFPIYLSELTAYKQHDQLACLFWGIYYGLLLTGFLYHLLLWAFTKQKGYAYLSLYLITYFLFEINRGFSLAQQYFWPTNTWLLLNGLSIFFTITLLAFLNFYAYAFGFRPTRKWPKLMVPFLSGYIVGLGAIPFVNADVSRNFIGICQFLPVALFLFGIGIYKLRKGYRHTQFYFYSLVCFIGGGVLFSLNRSGIMPGDDFVIHYTGNLGSILEIILMSFGVAFAMRREQKRALHHQEKAQTAFTEGRAEENNLVALRLHHEAGNNMIILLKSIEQLVPEQLMTAQQIKTLYSQAFDSYSMIRDWAHTNTPETLLSLGLGAALRRLLDRANQAQTTSFLLLITGDEEILPLKVQFELYYICVELVNNVLKHAQATEASLFLLVSKDSVTTECRDDGIGYPQTVGNMSGLGWNTIQKRLSRIGGTYKIHQPDRGTKVTITISLSDQPMFAGK